LEFEDRGIAVRVLAVDDDELMLELLLLSLRKEGFNNVTTTESAQAALDLIELLDSGSPDQEKAAFDCFLFDIQMPGMNGIELCRKVRALPQYARTPILMVTTLSDRKHVEEAFRAGASDYVTKPFDQVELASRMRMANSLAIEQRRGLYAYFMSSILDVCLEDKRAALFQSPVTIEGVENVVDFTVLENYLLQLSRKGLSNSVAVAFHDIGASQFFSQNNPESFVQRITLISQKITEAMECKRYLLSYFGSGNFVCVMDRKNYKLDDEFLERLHNSAKDGIVTAGENESPIIVGDPVFNTTHTTIDVRTVLLDAISSAIEKSFHVEKSSGNLKGPISIGSKFRLFQED